MSEEEKKSLYKLKSIVKVNNDFLKNVENQAINQEEIKALKIILNLIEKQQKENKKLKKLLQRKNIYTHQIEKDLFEGSNNYVVRKDKIRAKIIELKTRNSEVLGSYFFEFAIKILEELLKGEDNEI